MVREVSRRRGDRTAAWCLNMGNSADERITLIDALILDAPEEAVPIEAWKLFIRGLPRDLSSDERAKLNAYGWELSQRALARLRSGKWKAFGFRRGEMLTEVEIPRAYWVRPAVFLNLRREEAWWSDRSRGADVDRAGTIYIGIMVTVRLATSADEATAADDAPKAERRDVPKKPAKRQRPSGTEVGRWMENDARRYLTANGEAMAVDKLIQRAVNVAGATWKQAKAIGHGDLPEGLKRGRGERRQSKSDKSDT